MTILQFPARPTPHEPPSYADTLRALADRLEAAQAGPEPGDRVYADMPMGELIDTITHQIGVSLNYSTESRDQWLHDRLMCITNAVTELLNRWPGAGGAR